MQFASSSHLSMFSEIFQWDQKLHVISFKHDSKGLK